MAPWCGGLDPGVFAFVMATGIVSTALDFDGLSVVSDVLLMIGVAGYGGLLVVAGCRLVRWPRRLLAHLAVLTIKVAASTVWEILQSEGINPAPQRRTPVTAVTDGG